MVCLNRQRGFSVLAYVLLSLTLIGVASAVVAVSVNRASKADQVWATASQIIAQANLLRQKILDCAAQGGNNGGTHPAYPAAATAVAVTAMTCPASGAIVFNGTDGVFMPAPPTGFLPWTYVNDSTSVRIRLQVANAATVRNVTGYAAAMTKAVGQFGSEATRVTITSTNDTFSLTIAN